MTDVRLSDGTTLENVTARTAFLRMQRRASPQQVETAKRIEAAIERANGKPWPAHHLAAYLDHAIGTEQVDGGVLLLLLSAFDVHVRSARAGKATAARTAYTPEQRAYYLQKAQELEPGLSQRKIAERLETELGIPAETGREYLKPPRKARTKK